MRKPFLQPIAACWGDRVDVLVALLAWLSALRHQLPGFELLEGGVELSVALAPEMRNALAHELAYFIAGHGFNGEHAEDGEVSSGFGGHCIYKMHLVDIIVKTENADY